jgi:glycosyltransferase involved in cell wall biosynthesis
LLVGWYGGAAVEAMAFGLPVISFVNGDFLKHIPPEMALELPILSASPVDIEQKLEELIKNLSLRTEKSKMGLDFVKKWHNPHKIAKCMLELYKNPKQRFWELWQKYSRCI